MHQMLEQDLKTKQRLHKVIWLYSLSTRKISYKIWYLIIKQQKLILFYILLSGNYSTKLGTYSVVLDLVLAHIVILCFLRPSSTAVIFPLRQQPVQETLGENMRISDLGVFLNRFTSLSKSVQKLKRQMMQTNISHQHYK